ncbi:MAG: glutathione S-transferase family protein [Alphaproteobacteria bacterium]|jgi:glutathione S-transferase|nr:glutathione S-transferase family protein [Alphaproteobacteria bacterium]
MRLYELAGRDDLRFSPHCWRARLALAHKGLEAETVPVRFTDKQVIAHSGQGMLPVLEDGERVIADSWAIAGYLEDAYADRPSLFGSAEGHGLARFVNTWSAATLQPAIIRCIIKDIYDHVDPADQAYFRETREARFGKSLDEIQAGRAQHAEALTAALLPLRATLKAQPWLSGPAPLYPDYIVFGAFQWARCVSDFAIIGGEEDPLREWRDRVAALFDGIGDRVACYGA